jgi:hypothetical protein
MEEKVERALTLNRYRRVAAKSGATWLVVEVKHVAAGTPFSTRPCCTTS